LENETRFLENVDSDVYIHSRVNLTDRIERREWGRIDILQVMFTYSNKAMNDLLP